MTSASNARADQGRRRTWLVVCGLVLVVLVWHLASYGRPELVLPSPRRTVEALWELARSGALVRQTGGTLLRSLAGTAAAIGLGIPWGLAAGLSPVVAGLSEALLRTLISIPPVLFVVVAMIWLGPGPGAVVLVLALIGLPLMVVTTREAVVAIDPDLDEMVRAFDLGFGRRLWHLVLPAVTGPVLAGISVLLGQSLRVTVMAELLAASVGIGHEVALSRTNLDTATLFAWGIALAVLALVTEAAVIRPLSRRALARRR